MTALAIQDWQDMTATGAYRAILEQLSRPATCLAVAGDMEKAVLVREDTDGVPNRLGVIDKATVERLHERGWIDAPRGGRIQRFRLTDAGRAVLGKPAGRVENLVGKTKPSMQDDPVVVPYRTDTPVAALGRRRDKDGSMFLSPGQLRAAERLREDFELSQMQPGVTQDWSRFLTAGTSASHQVDAGPRGRDPQVRVQAALADLGPGLGDAALMCCCHLIGLETVERKMGWSARSGKIVLRIALERLRLFYQNQPADSGLIG